MEDREGTASPTPSLAHSVETAAKLSNSSRTTVYEAINSGDLLARKLGTRTIILDDDLRAWLHSLPVKEVE